jgi:ABC-2 type transport system ATP-binding protein
MKQKVSLASVLAGGAELVFLDEPTLGLDVESSRTLRRELRRLAREEGLTIVLSSHDMGVIEDVCDRVVMMANGRIVADDTVGALLSATERDVVRVVSADIDDALVAALRERFDVRAVEAGLGATERDGGGPTAVEVAAAGDALYDLMDALREAGVTVEDIGTVRPELEDVFVDLTGMEPGGERANGDGTSGNGTLGRGTAEPRTAGTDRPEREPGGRSS